MIKESYRCEVCKRNPAPEPFHILDGQVHCKDCAEGWLRGEAEHAAESQTALDAMKYGDHR